MTARLVVRAMSEWIPNPFSKIAERIRERAELRVSILPREGDTFVPQGGETITSDSFRDRKQYSLVLENESEEDFWDIRLCVQLPYPIESHQLYSTTGASGTSFLPIGMAMTFGASGSGARLQVLGRPLSRSYELAVQELRKHGRIEILFVLNSWRDPRGKTIPKEEAARYFIPESGPTLTYIHGPFKIKIGQEVIDREYYAPIALRDDKTIALGPPIPAPKSLILESGSE